MVLFMLASCLLFIRRNRAPLIHVDGDNIGAYTSLPAAEGLVGAEADAVVAALAVLLVLFYFREEIIQEGDSLLEHNQLLRIALLIGASVLVLGDGVYELACRLRRFPNMGRSG